jgi:uncharacterized membrane protein YcaP (DUF421 family)
VNFLLIVFIRAAILYLLLTFCVRLMGKRSLGDLQPSELVTTILISNIATLPMEDISMPMLFGSIPILVIVGLEIISSHLTLHFPFFRRLLSGNPVVIIEHGEILQQNLKQMRCNIDDLYASMRMAGFFDVAQIEYAVAETTGNLSFLPKYNDTPVTAKMMHLKPEKTAVPLVLISDGKLISSTKRRYHIPDDWLQKILKANGATIQTTFLLTVDEELTYHLVKRAKEI